MNHTFSTAVKLRAPSDQTSLRNYLSCNFRDFKVQITQVIRSLAHQNSKYTTAAVTTTVSQSLAFDGTQRQSRLVVPFEPSHFFILTLWGRCICPEASEFLNVQMEPSGYVKELFSCLRDSWSFSSFLLRLGFSLPKSTSNLRVPKSSKHSYFGWS